MILRRHQEDDYDAVRHIYAEACRRPDDPGLIPSEVELFDALCLANDVIDQLSFIALHADEPVAHVTASTATVGVNAVVAVGPIGVLPNRQREGAGSALMHAVLGAADALNVPLVVLLGSPAYYSRFGFRSAAELGVTPPEPAWGEAFQARPLTAHSPSMVGRFEYAPAFSS